MARYQQAPSEWQKQKAIRTEIFNRRHGVKMVVCAACGGSGVYDSFNSPKCEACDGHGKHIPRPVLEDIARFLIHERFGSK